MEDIKMAIEMAKTSNGPSSELLTCSLTDSSKFTHQTDCKAIGPAPVKICELRVLKRNPKVYGSFQII